MSRAFTLVEAVVFSAIGMAGIVTLFSIYRTTQRDMARVSVHLRGVQAAQLVAERLSDDLRATVGLVEGSGVRPLRVIDGSALEFHRTASEAPPEMPADPAAPLVHPAAVAVRWWWDVRTSQLMRVVGGQRPEPAAPARFRSISFDRIKRADGTDADLVLVALEWVPEEARAAGGGPQHERMTVRFALGIPGEARLRRHPYRVFDPTARIRPQ